MKKDFDKKKKRSARSIIIAIFLIAVFGTVFFDYQPEKARLLAANFSSVCKRIPVLMHEKKSAVDEKIEPVKQLAADEKKSTVEEKKPQEIHFEFYSVLPNMKVVVPETEKPVTAMKQVTEIHERPVVSVSAPVNIFDPGRLQNEWKEEFAQQYVVQTGVFKYASGAERTHQVLLKSGLPVRVVKIRMARGKAYSVQAGPFTTKDEAIQIQHQLKKKNITGIIRKL